MSELDLREESNVSRNFLKFFLDVRQIWFSEKIRVFSNCMFLRMIGIFDANDSCNSNEGICSYIHDKDL